MSDKKISALTAATTPLAGSEVLPIVQGGTTKKVAVSDVAALATVNLTGPITSVGAATAIASQTGTGSTFVMSASPTLTGTIAGANQTLSGTLGVTGVATLGNGAILNTPASMTGTNITGTAAGLTAGNVTTNANLTGPITSSGNATAIASQTGTGSTFVMSASPTLTGTIAGASQTLSGTLGVTGDVGIAATSRIFLDGVARTGDTYIYESAANVLSMVVGGATYFQLTAATPVLALTNYCSLTVSGALGVDGVSTFAAGSAAAPALTTTGDTNTGIFFPAADTIGFSEGGAEAMRIDSSGNVGIGTSSPGYKLETNITVAATTGVQDVAMLRAYSSGTTDGTFGARLLLGTENPNGNSWPAGIAAINDSGGSNLSSLGFYTATAGPTLNERARITSGGDFEVGLTYYAIIAKGADTNGQAWNGAQTSLYVGKVTGTGRSINAAGTINASGADYAEYMTKAGDFTIAKGAVCGIDAHGKLTNVFSDSVAFVVKSTNPSYVGWDSWGNEESLGLTKPEADAPQEDKDAFNDALEAARQTVDRIAFAGQVPVNVIGATAGQYIVPTDDNGAIKGVAVSNPNFEQYQQAVGKVIAIEADGRARIIVKVA